VGTPGRSDAGHITPGMGQERASGLQGLDEALLGVASGVHLRGDANAAAVNRALELSILCEPVLGE
jgi:hypothetical protein